MVIEVVRGGRCNKDMGWTVGAARPGLCHADDVRDNKLGALSVAYFARLVTLIGNLGYI